MTEQKHSSLPWRVTVDETYTKNHNRENDIRSVDDIIINTKENTANADLIVKAVNNHDKLVEELKKANGIINKLFKLVNYYGYAEETPNLRIEEREKALTDAEVK